MTDHIQKRKTIQDIANVDDIAAAIEKCNLRREYKTLLKILYVDGGCLEDVCEAVGKEYTTISKWHKSALMKLTYLLQKQGKI